MNYNKWVEDKEPIPSSRAAAKRLEDETYKYKNSSKWVKLSYHSYCSGDYHLKRKDHNDGFGIIEMWELSHHKKGVLGFFYKIANGKKAASCS